MGLINLPSLVQKIRVDTSDMKKAEGDATSFGTTLKAQNKDVEGSLTNLQKAQKDFKVSTQDMTAEMDTSTKSFAAHAKAADTVGFSHKQASKDTDKAGASFANFTKKVEGTGKSFGALSFSISDLKIPALGAAVGAGVGAFAALTAATGALLAQFGPMVGVVGAAAPLMLALKTSTGLVGAAFGELAKSKTNNVVKDLQNIQKAGVAAFSPGLVAGIKSLGPEIDIVTKGYAKLGATLGTAFANTGKDLAKQPAFLASLGVVMDNNARIAGTFAQALGPIATILVNITRAAGGIAQGFASDFLDASKSVADSSNNIAKLQSFFEKADKVARSFVGSMVDIGVAIKNVFEIGAKSIGIDFVGGLQSGAQKMKEFTQSTEGVAKITQFFKDAGPVVKELGLLFKDVLVGLVGFGDNQDLAGFVKLLRTDVLPSAFALADGANKDMLPAIAKLAKAFLDFNNALSFSPLITVVSSFADATSAAAGLIGQVPGLGQLVATLLLIKTGSKGLAIASNFTGLTSLFSTFKGIGSAGEAGAKGMAGFVQGLRGASGESTTFANTVGGKLKAGFSAVTSGAASAGKGLVAGIKSGVTGAGSALATLGTNAKGALVSLGSSLKGALVGAASSMKSLAVSAGAAAKQLLAAGAAGAKAAFSSLASAMGPVITSMKGAAAATKAFTLSLLTNPIFLIVAAVVALVAGLVLLYKKNETFRNFVNAAWANIKEVIGAVVDWLLNTAWPWIKETWDKVSTGTMELWRIIKGAWDGINQAIRDAVSFVVNFVKEHWQLLLAIIMGPLGLILGVIIKHWDEIKQTVSIAWELIKYYVSNALDTIKTTMSNAWEGIKTVASAFWEGLKLIVSTGWAIISGTFTTALEIIKTTVSSAWTIVTTVIGAGFTVLKTIFTAGWDFIKNIFTTVFAVIKALVTGHWTDIPGIINKGLENAKKIVGDAWAKIKQTISDSIAQVLTVVKSFPQKISDAVGNLGNLLYSKGQQVIQGLIDGIKSMFGALGSTASQLMSTIASKLPGSPVKEGPLTVLNRGYAGKQIVKMVNDGIKSSGGVDLGLSKLQIPSQLTAASASNFPRPPSGVASQAPGAVNNSRVYNVTINETQGPSTASSLTDRLRLIDVTL